MRPNRRLLTTLGLSAAISTFVGLIVWRAMAAPTVPQGIAYSGELLNNGTPESAMHKFSFALFDVAGGNPLCTDGPRNITTAAGRFDVGDLFGANCPLDTILATKTGLQLEITVDNTILTPRQPLGTVPFAARARVAESAESLAQTPVALGSAGALGDVVASLLTPAQFQVQRGPGWVLCDGSALGTTALGKITGAKNLPDLRGQFLRGFNNGRNDGMGDADGDAHALGAFQADQFASHTHTMGGVVQVPLLPGGGVLTPGGQVPTGSVGGNETRPRNVAVNFYCRVN